MKKVFTAKEMEAYLATGATVCQLPSDVVLTPSARDVIRAKTRGNGATQKAASTGGMKVEPTVPDYEYNWQPGADPQTPAEIDTFFHSPEIRVLRERMCAMGERIWAKGYVDGNGGNLTIRVGDNLVLCTPTLMSKGFMKPEEMCLVNLDGVQLAGTRKRTSEVNTHIAIMKRQPNAKACCHAHPPHATAFAVAGVAPPACMIPEAEVFLGQIGLAKYETPGSPENAKVVGDVGVNHQAIIMENHGVITWGKDIEDAYWKMENTDAYCLTIWMASQIGSGVKKIQPDKVRELIDIREALGMEDMRKGLKECELCDDFDLRPPTVCTVPTGNSGGCGCTGGDDSDPAAEAAVREITEQILKHMGNS